MHKTEHVQVQEFHSNLTIEALVVTKTRQQQQQNSLEYDNMVNFLVSTLSFCIFRELWRAIESSHSTLTFWFNLDNIQF